MVFTKTFKRCPICTRAGHDLPKLSYYLYCNNCRLAWLKRFPNTYYGDEYYKGTSSIASRLFTPIATAFYYLRNAYAGISRKYLWIDVGAGDGGFLKTVNSQNKIGVEISASGRRIMQESKITTKTEKEFLKVRRLNADVISFWHVLEHMTNPWDYLVAARHNIKTRGTLVIGIPNLDCLEYHLFGKRWFHSPQFHLWQFTPKAINRMLKKSGFRIQTIDYWSIEHHLPCLLQSCINVTSGSNGALHRFIKRGHTKGFTTKDLFWSIFWLTIGAPIVLLLWAFGAISHMAGTIVVVAQPIV